MNHYLLKLNKEIPQYLHKENNSFRFQPDISNFSLFTLDIDFIMMASLWKNINENSNIEAIIYEIDLKDGQKRELNAEEILGIEKELFLKNSLVNEDHIIFQNLFKTEAYYKLCSIDNSNEGNLLEYPVNKKTQIAQLSFLKYLLNHIKEDNSLSSNFLEIGTNKGFFGYILSQFYGNCTLHTIDINKESSKSVPILQDLGLFVYFILGDSKDILPNYQINSDISLAWVDGGHDYESAISDLENIVKYKPKYIAVDDVKFFPESVRPAYLKFLDNHPEYENFDNPFWSSDDVGIACCKLKE